MKKRAKKPAKPALVKRQLNLPEDWIERIDQARGETEFGEFVRAAILEKIDGRGLSDPPGRGRPKLPEPARRRGKSG